MLLLSVITASFSSLFEQMVYRKQPPYHYKVWVRSAYAVRSPTSLVGCDYAGVVVVVVYGRSNIHVFTIKSLIDSLLDTYEDENNLILFFNISTFGKVLSLPFDCQSY